jgi:hypothetical protein
MQSTSSRSRRRLRRRDHCGNANEDNNFRFSDGYYILNLKTTGLSTGMYKLYFTAGEDPTLHSGTFQVSELVTEPGVIAIG